jgi:hypothetical protein
MSAFVMLPLEMWTTTSRLRSLAQCGALCIPGLTFIAVDGMVAFLAVVPADAADLI